jgi:hypothetical protein
MGRELTSVQWEGWWPERAPGRLYSCAKFPWTGAGVLISSQVISYD